MLGLRAAKCGSGTAKIGARRSREYIFSPYYIEPNAIGQSTYVIGFREPPKALTDLQN